MISNFIQTTEGRIYTLDRVVIDKRPWVILIRADFAFTATLTLGGVTEANFSGYNRVQPLWPAATDVGNGDAGSLSPAIVFTHNGGATANTIYGIGIVENDGGFGTHLLDVYKFPVAVSMAVNGDNISHQIRKLQGQYALA